MTPALLCRLFGHRVRVSVVNIAGWQSYRAGRCRRCGLALWQRRGYYGGDRGPWRVGSGSDYGADGASARAKVAS